MEADAITPSRRDDSSPAPSGAGTTTTTAASGPPPATAKRKRVACTSCRESKVRCVGPDDRCGRCERLGQSCRTDAAFKRSNKRSKVEALEKQVEQLMSAVQHDAHGVSSLSPRADGVAAAIPFAQPSLGASDARPVTPRTVVNDSGAMGLRGCDGGSGAGVGAGGALGLRSTVQQRPGTAEREDWVTPGSEATESRSLEGVEVSPAQANSLFQLYFTRFHPFLPFLDPARSPEQYYEGSALLFWAIITVAARRHRDFPRLLENLATPVSNLLWKSIQLLAIDSLDVPQVQAVIVLCTWPLPTTRVWTDATFLLSNIAVTSCIQLGLHRPQHPKEFLTQPSRQYQEFSLNESETNERMKTWAACNIVSQCITSDFGHGPAGSCFDWAVDQACDDGTGVFMLPDEIRHSLILERFCNRVTKAMLTGANSTGLPLEHDRYLQMMLLEEEINVIEQQLGSQLSEINLLRHCEARLYLHLYHFLDSSLTEPRKNGILKAYSAATALVTRIISNSSDGTSWYSRLLYAPLHFFRVLCTASIVLLTTLNSTYSEYIDYSSGKLLFNSAVFALRRQSQRDGDTADRGAGILADMWTTTEASFRRAPQEPRVRIKARMAASLTYDALLRHRTYKAHKGASTAADKGLPTPVSGSGPGNEADVGLMPDSIMDYWQDYPNPNFIWDDDFSATLADLIA